MNIIREAGGLKDLSGIMQNVSNVAYVMFIVRKVACSRPTTVSFRRIWIIARAAAFALMNVGPVR